MQIHFSSNLIDSLTSPTNGSMKIRHFTIVIIKRKKADVMRENFLLETSILLHFTSIYHYHHSLHQNMRSDTRNLTQRQLMTRSNKFLVVKITWATIMFLYSDMFTLHCSKTMREIPSFLSCLTKFKLMDFATKSW